MKIYKKWIAGIIAAAVIVPSVAIPLSVRTSYAENASEDMTDNADSGSGTDPEVRYDPVSVNINIEVSIDGDDKGFDRDMSKNQFAFRVYYDGGTDENGNYNDLMMPKDALDEDDPETTIEEAPCKIITSLSFDKPGTNEIKIRQLLPSEGLKDEEGKPLPEESRGMKYDTTIQEVTIDVKVEDGKLMPYVGDVNYGENSYLYCGTFENITGTAKVLSAVTKINGKTGTLDFNSGEDHTITNEAEFGNLEEGVSYTAEFLLFKDYEPIETKVCELTKDTEILNVTFDKKADEADEYKVVNILKQGEKTLYIYNGNFNEDDSIVTLKAPREIPEEDPTIAPTESTEQTTGSTEQPTESPTQTDTSGSTESTEGTSGTTAAPESSRTPDHSERSSASPAGGASSAQSVSKAKAGGSPDSGDVSNMLPLMITIVSAGAGIAATAVVLRKRK